ncbi:MAG: putative ORFan [Satyrvirus sp.]|uniref:Putative ORFan n=1 Tax=Satyrvirus sp. TaxID=2487771 RepID=A0A3G5AEM2_9VIRU|nr:MAG: putative ORFan [Satyrvirus sp.]
MNFVVSHDCEILRKKGLWRPLFKTRYVAKYYDTNKKDEYEHGLYNRLFGDNDNSIVIRKNMYEFNLGKDLEQFVVWIRDKHNDPGIDHIVKIIEEEYPDMDYNIYLNKPENKTIKNIQHYHAILKNPSQIYLKKIIILVRHANREPITKLPSIEKLLNNDNMTTNSDAKLLPIGHQNSIKFGDDIRKIYELDDNFISNMVFLSSPFERCRDTLTNIATGLKLKVNFEIIDTEKLKIESKHYVVKFEDITGEFDKLFFKYEKLIDKLGNIFGFQNEFSEDDLKNNINRRLKLAKLYDYYSSMACYKDMGIDTIKFMDEELEKEFEEATLNVYNIMHHNNQFMISSHIKNIISDLINLDSNLVIGCTHDTLIFIIAKFFSHIHKTNFNYELPHYLSNIRIEEWTDGVFRIYYNNWLLNLNSHDLLL